MKMLEISDQVTWDNFVDKHPQGHPLQLWGWGEAKRGNGWTPYRLALMDGGEPVAGVQVLLWKIPRLNRFIAYVPRGPVVDPDNPEMVQLLDQLTEWARAHRAWYVRVEPAWLNVTLPKGWVKAKHTIQMFETYTINLAKSEDELLEPMARKHRQYIRKAERDGVVVERVEVADLGPMYEIYAETAQRAGFGIHPLAYYAQLLQGLGERNYLYYAKVEDRPVAFLWLAAAGDTAYELYGGVNDEGQDVKANYFLKWRAMMEQKAAGRHIYDFNGRVSEGVSQFKAGFGPDETDYMGTWDYSINMAGYQVWERLWPVVKVVGRRLKGRHRK